MDEVRRKNILMHVFVYTVTVLSVAVFMGMHWVTQPQPTHKNTYKSTIEKYITQYESAQEPFQLFSFYENYDKLVMNNHKLNEEYRKGVKQLWPHTEEQFYQMFRIVHTLATKKGYTDIATLQNDYKDWSSPHVKVKNMKYVPVSFVFSVLSAMEYWINANLTEGEKWVELSAQEIIDCCPECMAEKKPDAVYKYIMENGVTTEEAYPYRISIESHEQGSCLRNQSVKEPRYKIEDYRKIKNCTSLFSDLIQGPVVVGVDARSWMTYQYDTFSSCEKKTTHYGLVVGFSSNYWKVQNSWGQKWGELGYIRLGPGNTCGICLHGSVPIFTLQE